MLEPMTIDTSQSSVGFDPTPNAPAAPAPTPVVPANPSAAMSIRGLFKRFGDKVAVNGLSPGHPDRLVLWAGRPQRGGQDDHAEHGDRVAGAGRRHGHDPGP